MIKSLGKGGFGTVYLVKDLQTNEQKALKISRDMLTLVREFTILEKFNNMAIQKDLVPKVELMDDGIINGHILGFIIMEYIDGTNLRSLLRCRRFSMPEIFALVKLLGVLLNLLHKSGYVYCDLKPENILYDAKGAAFRLVDFGGVKEIGSAVTQFTPAFDRTSYGCGTRKADPGYDVFALCALMVTLETGKDPLPKNPDMVDSPALAIVWKKARQNKFTDVAGLLRECRSGFRYSSPISLWTRVAIYSFGILSAVIFGITLMQLLH